MKRYYAEHLCVKKKYDKKRRLDNLELMRKQGRDYSRNNRKKRNALQKEMKKRNPSYRIACNMRSRLWMLLKSQNAIKADHTVDMIGCSWNELRIYLESLFLDGMTWKNYGKTQEKWSIDHIRPCASFDLKNIEEQKKCFYYKNLRPMWNTEQWTKNSYYGGRYIRSHYIRKNST